MSDRAGRPMVRFVGGSLLLGVLVTVAQGVDGPQDRPKPEAAKALEPVAPIIPAEVVAALQEHRYADAIAELKKNEDDPKTKKEDRAYLVMLRSIALRLAGKLTEARTELGKAIEADPHGPWAAKLRFEQAVTELAAGRPAAAEALARAEVDALLADARKDRLADIDHEIARKLLKPDDPVAQPDPNGAYQLLAEARSLAKGTALRARLLFEMARAKQAANDPATAIRDFQAYLSEAPKGADHLAARFHLGEAQLAAGQPVPARLTWADLVRDLESTDTAESIDIRARSLMGIAKTYGIPAPPDDTQLNLGIAALRRLLKTAPSHPLAVQAAYDIGRAYLARGQSEPARAAFLAFLQGEGFEADTPEARRQRSELSMAAQFQVGQILQGQEKFDEAIAAWRGYLAKYPNGPQSADAQRAILDTQLLIAQTHLRHEQYDAARAAWNTFLAQNPLDARVPQILFDIGQSFATQEKFDAAIAAWETLVGKFPGSEPAAHAEFAIAATLETEKGDPAAAIERFKKVAAEPWKSQAQQRIAVMEAKALTVVTPRTFRSGEKPELKITTRNIDALTFTAFKLNPEAYFRKKHTVRGVESLDIGLVAPDAEWTEAVPGAAKYKPVVTTYTLSKLEVPGVWVVKVSDERTLQATTLVIGSDVDAIVKASGQQVLVFVQDMTTGKGRAGARVLIAGEGAILLEGKTGKDGVLLRDWDKPRAAGKPLSYLVLDGPDVAGSGLGLPDRVAQGLSPRAYLETDRPAYRPGQTAELRGVVREVKDGQYTHDPGAVYRLEVHDSRGRLILRDQVKLSEFGTFHRAIAIDSAAPVGTYRIHLSQPGKSGFHGAFEVQAYQLQKVDLAFELPRTVYFRGETVKADLVARYQYGAPLAGRPIAVELPDGRTLHGTTNAEGKYHVEFPTEGFAEEQSLRIVAQLPQENVAIAARVMLAIRAFQINLAVPRPVYLDGETIPLKATTLDARGEPTGQELTVSVLKRVETAGRVTEREVSKETLQTDTATGKGTKTLRIEDEEGGNYLIRVAGTDRFGNAVVSESAVVISGKKDAFKLRLLADRTSYRVGETARVNLHNRSGSGPALLTWEADRILSYKVVTVQEGDNPVSWTADGAQFPNFTLTAARMAGNKFHEARLDLTVERDLRVTVEPSKATAGPDEDVDVVVTTKDQLGNPVAAEVSLALIDRALLRLYGDRMPPIGDFFYNQTRTGAFTTEATNPFRYEPRTTGIAQAIVEEDQRALLREAEAAKRGEAEIQRLEREVQRGVVDPQIASQLRSWRARAESQNFAFATPSVNGPMAGGMGAGVAAADETAAATGLALSSDGRRDVRLGRKKAAEFYRRSLASAAISGKDAKQLREKLGLEEAGDVVGVEDADLGDRLGYRGRGGQAQPPSRQQFVETAYWNPSLVTGKDGRARVTIKAPKALSRYEFRARGVTARETLVGQTTAELAVRKDFFVDLKLPSVLNEGDRPRFLARVHHTGVSGPAKLRLAVYAGGRDQVYPRTIDLKNDGVEEVELEAFEVPDGESVRLTLAAQAGETSDELVAEVPIRPWGEQALASASGTAHDDATVFVELPAGRTYENPEMLIVVSPSVRRMLVELALGRDAYVVSRHLQAFLLPPVANTTADRASDLLGVASVLASLRRVRGSDAPEASRLGERAQGLVGELVSLQNDDGGWPWIAGAGATPAPGQKGLPSERMTTARAVLALAAAARLGLVPDPQVLDKATTYLSQEFAKVDAADSETRAAILHALSARDKATFEQANSLNRVRQGLSNVALAELALTFANLDRTGLANEVLGVLAPRSRTESAGPGQHPRRYWDNPGRHQWHTGRAETTALAALAFARVRPDAPELAEAADWLLAHRVGAGWQPHRAKGAALAALALDLGQARAAEDRYRLVVTVNDTEVGRLEVVGPMEGKAIAVPTKSLKPGAPNRVRFDLEGRGTFSYTATLTGFTREFKPDQDRANRPFVIGRRVYLAAEPELEGKPLPTGFGVAVNPQAFENKVTQVAPGGRARVALDAYRNPPPNRPAWEQDFLVLEEQLPAGTTLIEGSVQSQASHYDLADGVLTFYFAPDQWPGNIQYDVYGYLPGQYRALPPRLSSAYDPGRRHLGPVGELRVLDPGATSSDPYKPTPDELYARGKRLFDLGRLADAAEPLESLFGGYTLRADVAKDAARMLLEIHIDKYDPRKVVQYFEVLKEKAPELVLSFDTIRVVGRAYRDIGEHERAYLVWRATAEASYLEDARIGQVLRERGKTLEAIAYLLALWRESPNTASIESDFFGISQLLSSLATRAETDAAVRQELTSAHVAPSELLLQSIRLIQVFLSQSPTNPVADEASLALVNAFLALEDDRAVVRLAQRFARLYPRSTFQDSFQYSEALGRFHLGQYDRAIEVAERIARATYKDANGVEQPSPNKWQAIYILGQIYDARRQPAKALTYYQQVADQFSDAAGAIKALTRRELKVPEVAVIRPLEEDRIGKGDGPGVGLRAIAPVDDAPPTAAPEVRLDYRNIKTADVKVYPVDLMRLYLARRNLAGIADIDLAGITPLVEKTVTLDAGTTFEEAKQSIPLPLRKEGAYLVMIRGDEQYASGIVLVSPLTLEVLEEPDAGRVRITVRDARTGDFVPKVQVKVIGSENPSFFSGETDLRGVFVAEGVQGVVTTVARKGSGRYALYRGTQHVGAPRPAASAPSTPAEGQQGQEGRPSPDATKAGRALERNLFEQNTSNQMRQIDRLQQRYGGASKPQGVQVQAADEAPPPPPSAPPRP